jgi:hypothetical protein
MLEYVNALRIQRTWSLRQQLVHLALRSKRLAMSLAAVRTWSCSLPWKSCARQDEQRKLRKLRNRSRARLLLLPLPNLKELKFF